MKYGFMPKLMWNVYKGTFKKYLSIDLNENKNILKNAYLKYKEIVLDIDEFDKNDSFIINILSCAMLSSILLNLEKEHSVDEIKKYYKDSICNNIITKMAMTDTNYTKKGRKKLHKHAEYSQKCNNPYSWKFKVIDTDDINKYTAIFHSCGICYLMNKLGLNQYIPAMCSLDYDMAEMNNTKFERKYTIASGGEYCDCNYTHNSK